MDLGHLLGRGISFPPRIGPDGRFAWSVGSQNIRESIRIILMTQAQERLLLPEFGGGLHSFLFQPNIVSTHRLIQERVTQALLRWEPRIQVESVTVAQDPENMDGAIITIAYKLISTGEGDQIYLNVQLST